MDNELHLVGAALVKERDTQNQKMCVAGIEVQCQL